MDLANGKFTHKPPEKKNRSTAWARFDEIYDGKIKISHFLYCKLCRSIVHKPSSNTNSMLRHMCNNLVEGSKIGKEQIIIAKKDTTRLKEAAAKFVAKDLRPFYAVQCEGLLDLCFACVEFGQNNRKVNRNTFIQAMPSRNTVKATVTELADKTRKHISEMMKKAIATGGIAATTDTWTDDYRHTTYICVVAHLVIPENGLLKYYRFVLSTSEISEMVKTGKN